MVCVCRYEGSFQSALAGASADSITVALRDLYSQMDKTADGIPPIILLQLLHMAFPQFAEKTEHGTYQQQVCLDNKNPCLYS